MKKQKCEDRKYKKDLKRFDPILKEIFSKAAGKLISIATGEKIKGKLEDTTTEIELVKSLRPDMLLKSRRKSSILKYKLSKTKTYQRGCLYTLSGLKRNSTKTGTNCFIRRQGKSSSFYF